MLFRRMAKTVAIVVAAVMALAIAPLSAAPASAAPTPRTPESFTLNLVEGQLRIRDSDEPYALQNPTSIAGTVDTGEGGSGAITGASFTTPTVTFQQEALGFPVAIDAEFSGVTPGSAIGSVDSDGNVFVQASLRVDLHIEVGNPVFLTTDCSTSPVVLGFDSTSPYSPETHRVTLADADFSIPAVPTGTSCNEAVRPSLNEQLAGAGHAISLTLEGDLELPPPPPPAADATLVVTPAGQSRLGDAVTLDATVVPGPDAETPTTPTGFVDFRDGSTVLGTVALDGDGKAQLVTSALAAGPHSLSVRYRGDGANGPDESTVAPHMVTAAPALTAELPPSILIGSPDATEFPLRITSTGFSEDIVDPRIDVSIRRPLGAAALTPSNVILTHDVGGSPQPITLAGSGTLTGSFAPGVPLGPDAAPLDLLMGLSIASGTSPGPLEIKFSLVGDDDVVIGSATGTTQMGESPRRDSTVVLGVPGQPAVWPPLLRQGNNVRIPTTVNPQISGVRPTGHLEYFLDGRPILVRVPTTPLASGYLKRLPLAGGSSNALAEFPVPAATATGTHEVTVRYSGDAIYKPSQVSGTLTVTAGAGPVYECSGRGLTEMRFTVNLVAQADLPSARAAGSMITLGALDMRLLVDRGAQVNTLNSQLGTGVTPVGTGNLAGIDFSFGPNGSGTATATERSGTSMTTIAAPPAVTDPDQVVAFQGESGSLVLEGAPGEIVPITVDEIKLTTITTGGVFLVLSCVPQGEPEVLGEVTVAGTTLSVDPGGSVRQGTPVELSASVAPATAAGFVEFTANGETIGYVPVEDGVASMTTSTLAAAPTPYDLQATFYGGMLAPTTESNVEQLTVKVAKECPAQLETGNGAVVRLVFLELLNRCASQPDYEFWKGQLDGGLSPEVFAKRITSTNEALGLVVDDGYLTTLVRRADTPGKQFWIPSLRGSGRYDQLLADLAASSEFWTAAGQSNSGFVTLVYQRILGRAPDSAGLAYWTARLDGGESRRTLVRTLAKLAEPIGQIVDDSYDEILGRAPSAEERAAAIAQLQRTGDRAALYASLIGTEEFATRADTFPNPED